MDAVLEAQRKSAELSKMMAVFSAKVVEQHAQAEEIHALAEESTAHVQNAEKQLMKAMEHQSSYRFYVVRTAAFRRPSSPDYEIDLRSAGYDIHMAKS